MNLFRIAFAFIARYYVRNGSVDLFERGRVTTEFERVAGELLARRSKAYQVLAK